MGVTIARGLIGGTGLLLVLSAFVVAALMGPRADLFAAVFLFVQGAVLIVAVVLERTRYRSLHAERTGETHGVGGGETRPLDERFRATDERFLDPTTNIPIQVWLDPATGERRYVPLP